MGTIRLSELFNLWAEEEYLEEEEVEEEQGVLF